MIVVKGKDTGMAAYIHVKDIVRTEYIKADPCSFTRVFLCDPKQGHDYFLDIMEKPEEIERKIKEERHIPGSGVQEEYKRG